MSIVMPLLQISVLCLFVLISHASAGDLRLDDLIAEGLKNNPEIRAAASRVSAARHRIPQVESLPDPMFMFGYQNDSFNRITYGSSPDSKWMFFASQTVPFPGKRALRGAAAASEAEKTAALLEEKRLKVAERIRELYYDLFFAYKGIEIVGDKAGLFSKIEEIVLSRYAAGKASQQEVLMVQTDKYLLLEREAMHRQKLNTATLLLNTVVGREPATPAGKPPEFPVTEWRMSLDEMLRLHTEHSPLVKIRENAVRTAETRVEAARREYYPDFTFTAGYEKRKGDYTDMWSLSTSFSIPLFYRDRQRQGVLEAEANLAEERAELDAVRLAAASAIREYHAVMTTAERLIDLYSNGLIPRVRQETESALASYMTGGGTLAPVASGLKSLVEYELQLWIQRVEREKAAARLGALIGPVQTHESPRQGEPYAK